MCIRDRAIFLVKEDRKTNKKRGPKVKRSTLGGAKSSVQKIKLSVATKPWANIFVDGKKVGISPFVGVRITPGRHTLLFQNRSLKVQDMKIKVNFQKSKDVKCIYDLEKRTGSCK